jgi:hypothetical protein
MSITLDNAAVYIAKVMGGAGNTVKTDLAKESIKATAEMWSLKNQWHFLLNRQTITVLAGTDRYTLTAGAAFSKPFSARFTGPLKRPIRYIPQQFIDAVVTDLTTPGDPEAYTIIDDDVDFDPAAEVQKLQLFPVPRADDTLLLRYYRMFNGAATTVDVPLRYLYTFLDCARIHLLMTHDSANPRLPFLIRDMFGDRYQAGRFQLAIADDRAEGGDDQREGFVPADVEGSGFRFSGPGDAWPRGDY